MAKFCTNCGDQLDDNAAMCLRCGKLLEQGNQFNQNSNGKDGKKKGLPVWAIVLIVVGCVILLPILLIVVFAVIGYNVIKDSEVDIKDYIEETVTVRGTIGDTLKTDDFKITLKNAKMYSSVGNGYYAKYPSSGKEYLVFFFEIENISNESEYIFDNNFSGYVDGYNINHATIYTEIEGIERLSVNLASKMKTNGYVAFEVDTTWKEFEIHYNDNDYDDIDEKLIFKVVNEENNKDA